MAPHWLSLISPVLRPDTNGYSHTGSGVAPPDYLQPKRIIYDHELILYQGSRFMIETETEQLILEPDSYLIFPPGLLHTELNIGERQGYRYWCHFDWCWHPVHEKTPVMTIMPGEPRFHLCRPAPAYVPKGILYGRLESPAVTYKLAQAMIKVTGSGGEIPLLRGRGLLLQLLIHILERGKAQDTVAKNTLGSLIRERLDRGSGANITTTDLRYLLRDFEYSYEHMSRVFRATYGVSPRQYISAKQLSRARFLLCNSNFTIAEIAYKSGFNSPAYFGKIFHEKEGCTPGDYRRRVKLSRM